jgi:MoaA/NifB/PqqE/SkfB family radical SAM enzyme
MSDSLRLSSGTTPSPSAYYPHVAKLTFEPTYRCPLRCRMCFFWGPHSASRTATMIRGRDELAFDAVRDLLLPQCVDCGVDTIAFAGGEVLLRPDILDVLELFRNAGLATIVESSLAVELTDAELDRLASASDYIWTSIDGIGSTHDAIRGRQGAFALTIRNVRELVQKRGGRSSRILVNLVLQDSNVEDLVPLAELLVGLGVDSFRVQLLSWSDSAASLPVTDRDTPSVAKLPPRATSIRATHAWEKIVLARTILRSAGKAFHSFPPYAALDERLVSEWYDGGYHGEYFDGCGRIDRPRIDAYGNVYMCVNGGPSLGNVRDMHLGEIWQSTRRADFAAEVAAQKPRVCHTCCKQAWKKEHREIR